VLQPAEVQQIPADVSSDDRGSELGNSNDVVGGKDIQDSQDDEDEEEMPHGEGSEAAILIEDGNDSGK